MSNMRISGMASGMDTDLMVQNMMRVERMKVSRYEQNKQVALWKQESYNNMNKLFANFILNSKKDIGIGKGSSFNSSYSKLDYVKKATSSNEMAATVSSTSKAVNGSFNIKVEEMATSGTVASGDMSTALIVGGMSFKINGETITVGEVGDTVTMNDVVKTINLAKKTVDGNEVSLGVTAFYDETNKRLFMQTTNTGAPVLPATESIWFEKTGSGSGDAFLDVMRGTGFTNIAGTDAKIIYNGVELKYSSNNFNLNGINIEAKSIGSTTINVSTNVEGIMEKVEKLVKDYNDLVDLASGFLSEKKYPNYKPLTLEEKNEMKENDVKLWEEKARSGLLSNDETINRALQTVRNSLYKDLLDEQGNKIVGFNHITQIGISTESYSRGSAGGKLQIDTEKLRKAIEDDPEGVMNLLFTEPKYGEGKLSGVTALSNERNLSGEQITAKREQSGIFTRVFDDLIAGMKNIIDKSGSGNNGDLLRNVHQFMLTDFTTTKSSVSDIDKQVQEMNRQMDNLNILLAKKEDSYYAKFTQMEKYMQQMSSQSNWLSQQFMR